jgi:hypothetical protein
VTAFQQGDRIKIRVDCGDCGVSAKVDVGGAIEAMRAVNAFGFGKHVTDARAFVLRAIRLQLGWAYTDGRLGRTTVTARCLDCQDDPLVLEADEAA